METYLMMLYVSLDQEKALKSFFQENGWPFCKPDLAILTDRVGPVVTQTVPDVSSIVRSPGITPLPCPEIISLVAPTREKPGKPIASSTPSTIHTHSHHTRSRTSARSRGSARSRASVRNQASAQNRASVKSQPSSRSRSSARKQVSALIKPVATEVHAAGGAGAAEKEGSTNDGGLQPDGTVQGGDGTNDRGDTAEQPERTVPMKNSISTTDGENTADRPGGTVPGEDGTNAEENTGQQLDDTVPMGDSTSTDDVAGTAQQLDGTTPVGDGTNVAGTAQHDVATPVGDGTNEADTAQHDVATPVKDEDQQNEGEITLSNVTVQPVNVSEVSMDGSVESMDENTITVLLMMDGDGDTSSAVSDLGYFQLDNRPGSSPDLTSTAASTSDLALTDGQLDHYDEMEELFELTDDPDDTESKKKSCEHKCGECEKSYVNKSSLDRHRKSHIAGLFRCSACSMYFDTNQKKLSHDSKFHPGMCLCPVCGGGFTRREGLRKHMVAQHPENISDAKYTCHYRDCGRVFDNKQLYRDHLNAHMNRKPYTCKYCTKTFHRKLTCKLHMASCSEGGALTQGAKAKLTCKECQKEFQTKGSLYNHQTSVHGNQRFVCSCGKVFKYRPGLINHMARHHKGKKLKD